MQLDITAERFIERVVLRLDESSGNLLDAALGTREDELELADILRVSQLGLRGLDESNGGGTCGIAPGLLRETIRLTTKRRTA
jgi:hypothetical protein